jgi:hypothetical protein
MHGLWFSADLIEPTDAPKMATAAWCTWNGGSQTKKERMSKFRWSSNFSWSQNGYGCMVHKQWRKPDNGIEWRIVRSWYSRIGARAPRRLTDADVLLVSRLCVLLSPWLLANTRSTSLEAQRVQAETLTFLKEHHHYKRGIIEALLDGWHDNLADQVWGMGSLDCLADMRNDCLQRPMILKWLRLHGAQGITKLSSSELTTCIA